MSDNGTKVDLNLDIEDAVTLSGNGDNPQGRLNVMITVRNKGEMYANVGAGNFEFLLNSEAGTHLSELKIKRSDDFELINQGGTDTFRCRLDVTGTKVDVGKPYQLQVNAFGETRSEDFKFQ